MKRLLFPLVVVLGLLLSSAVVLATPTAAADPRDCPSYVPCSVVDYQPSCPSANWTWGPEKRSRVCFNPNGDYLYVCDTRADGHHATAYYRGNYDPPGTYPIKNYNTSGTCVKADFTMPAGTWIEYKACWGDDDTGRLECSPEVKEVPAS